MFIINATTTPRFGAWFEGTDHQFASVLLVVGALIGNPNDRHIAGQGIDGLRDNIKMFTSMQRNVHAN